MTIGQIDCVEQCFRAQIFFELRFPGGALDPDLNAQGDEFPAPVPGRLPRPPAAWFLNQVDLKNTLEHTDPLNSLVRHDGDDLILSMRFEGTFFENMELHMFPFDMQELSIDVAVNCRRNGKLPVDLSVAKDAKITSSPDGFALHQLYGLDSRMTFTERFSEGVYPTITLSARVYRRPSFVIVNVAIPMAVFVLLSFLQFAVPPAEQDVRLGVTLTLVLTAAAYKYTVSEMMPNISYLTFMDKYVLLCFAIIFILVVEGALIGAYTKNSHPPVSGEPAYWPLIDLILLGVFLLLFLALHVWAGFRILSVDRSIIEPGRTVVQIEGARKLKGGDRMFFLESKKDLLDLRPQRGDSPDN